MGFPMAKDTTIFNEHLWSFLGPEPILGRGRVGLARLFFGFMKSTFFRLANGELQF